MIAHRQIERSTVAVLTNTAATGALGALFWLLAARLYPEREVAASVAAASLLIAVAFLAQLNLGVGLSRFLPGAGAAQRAILRNSYRLAVTVASVVGLGVLIVGELRGGSIVEGGSRALTLVVAVSVPIWVVFALQDGALVAARKAHWLPIENGLTTVLKLALLPALAWWTTGATILVAWTLPIVPAVVLVNRALYRRLLQPGDERPVSTWSVVRYSGADLFGAAATMLSLRIVPVMVVESVEGHSAAHVAVAWSMLAVAALALTAVSRLVLSEMSHDPSHAADVAARAARFVAVIFVPASLAGAAAAPIVLRLAGSGYSAAAPVLAVGLLGLIPAAMLECRFAVARFNARMLGLTVRQSARAVLLLSGTAGALAVGRPEWIGGAFALANAVVLLTVPRLGGTTHFVTERPVSQRAAPSGRGAATTRPSRCTPAWRSPVTIPAAQNEEY